MNAQDTRPTNGVVPQPPERGASLGSITKSASRTDAASPRAIKYALQAAARKLHPDARIRNCMRAIVPNRDTVDVWHNVTQKRAFYRGLMRCNQLWICPVCASWISEHRRAALAELLSQRLTIPSSSGLTKNDVISVPMWYVGLATFTISHHAGERLVDVKQRLDTAYQYEWSGRWAVAWRAKHNVIGTIRSLEVTHGENGWHPHYHTLLIRNSANAAQTVAMIELELSARWGDAVRAARGSASAERGVRFQGWDIGAVEYLSKMGQYVIDAGKRWDVIRELTKAPAKRGKVGGHTTWELLADYVSGEIRAGELWIEAAAALKGSRHLVASPGLYNRLGATLDLESDRAQSEEILAPSDRLLATLSVEQWGVVIRKSLQSDLLDVADSGDQDKLIDWLEEIIG